MGKITRMITLFIIKLLLRIHSFSYKAAGFLASGIEENNLHPKHRIMDYHRFFVNNISENDTVMDIGCGNGALTYDIAKKAKRVVGIDLNRKNISFANKNYPGHNIEYICGDALAALPDERFDVIVLSNVLEHIENRIEFLLKLRQKAPELLIRVPMIDRDWITLYKKELGIDHTLDKGHYVEYTLESFKNELGSAGFTIRDHSIQFGEIWAVAGIETDKACVK